MPDAPLLYIDVDGVLNPADPYPADGFRRHELLGYEVLLSPVHGEWLRELSGTYRLCWATTWQESANEHLAPLLGLPELPVVGVNRYVRQPGDPRTRLAELFSGFKWAPILRHAAGRPFAWIDDVIPPRLVRNSTLRPDRLLIPVDPHQGLERHHVDRLLRRPPRTFRRPRH
ncbi:HAD domain-containing protein [Kitasatospora sp. NPDC085895]|uniref:HAD domain-containing protein n=1 Tax=Kitasatospora sp. NPDC085895 TaxID=3155057 RepID=UPI00344BDFA4